MTTGTKKLLALLIVQVLVTFNINAQEVLIPLNENPTLINHLKNNPALKAFSNTSPDTLSLPFFDDFSNYLVYPSDSFWIDKRAFVNQSYGIIPPSIGVVTLDAIDYNGRLYDNASVNGFLADELTSVPIDLNNITADDSLFLSFYYQAMGRGDAPELNDSLYLEVYSPETENWYWIWGQKGSFLHDFKIVNIWIPDTLPNGVSLYHKGFQFRFSNYASLTPLAQASFAGNVDHWHLDYIYLNTGRTAGDTLLLDLTFLDPPYSLLREYTSMPYLHYYINASQLKTEYAFRFANHRTNSMIVDFSLDVINLLDNNTTISLIPGGQASDNFDPGDTTYTNTFSGNPFFSGDATIEEALFKVQAVIKPGEAVADFTAKNDTAFHYQHFYNYYAYDDGTAESGYGLFGEGTQNALLAYRFRNYYTGDSLRALQMYFNQTLGNANEQYFFIMVWDHDSQNMKPGNLIYSQIGILPQFGDSLNQFKTYRFKNSLGNDTAINIPDTFYVGWKQTSTQLLNIGFDKNSVNRPPDSPNWMNPNIYYNISGNWVASAFEGALMMRPVFQFEGILAEIISTEKKPICRIYPNPAKDFFMISIPDEINYQKKSYELYNMQGQLISSKNFFNRTEQIQTNKLPAGLYFIKVQLDNFTLQEKILIHP